MAFLPMFKTTKRPMGQNGAVRFLNRTEDISSNITQKKKLLKILNVFLDIRISKLIYNTKRPVFMQKL